MAIGAHHEAAAFLNFVGARSRTLGIEHLVRRLFTGKHETEQSETQRERNEKNRTYSAHVFVSPPVVGPLPDIADAVVQAVSVGCKRVDRRQPDEPVLSGVVERELALRKQHN